MSDATPHITQVRQHLLATLADLRNREQPMETDRARAVAQVAGVLIESARVEVDYLKVTGQAQAGFLEQAPQTPALPQGNGPSANNPFPRVTRHRIGE